ncbi:MAG TPA: hypothetical protein VFC03_17240 [Acidimicrobiales bacterium]|nr:hypothetical protein [Acidimicrobiales bacterium]
MKEIRELIRRLAERGVTVFSSGHLLHEVEQVCGRVTVLAEGRVVAQGSVSELLGGRERAIPKRSSAETKVSPAKYPADRRDGRLGEVGEVAAVLVAHPAAFAIGAAQQVGDVDAVADILRLDCGYVN